MWHMLCKTPLKYIFPIWYSYPWLMGYEWTPQSRLLRDSRMPGDGDKVNPRVSPYLLLKASERWNFSKIERNRMKKSKFYSLSCTGRESSSWKTNFRFLVSYESYPELDIFSNFRNNVLFLNRFVFTLSERIFRNSSRSSDHERT